MDLTKMRALIASVLLFCVILEQGQHPNADLPRFPISLANNVEIGRFVADNLHSDRIVGGELAKAGDFAYQVSLHKFYSADRHYHYCGGSVVSSRVVVSAGHCASGQDASKVKVCAGALNLKTECKFYEVKNITVQENYNFSTIDSDLSAFILADALDFSDPSLIAPVELPEQDSEVSDRALCTVSGWGTTTEGGGSSENLRYVDVPIVLDARCKECYGAGEITPTMICAGEEQGGKDSCQGDSGGPMVTKTTPKLLVGIVSWGVGCARPAYPGVYTKVSKFSDWINQIISEQG